MIDINNLPVGEIYTEDGTDYILLQELEIGTGYYFAIQRSENINPAYVVLVNKK